MNEPAPIPRYVAHISDDGERFESVATHLHEVAQMAREFAEPFGAGNWAYAMGLAHDIGKYSAEFQNRILRGGYKVDHSTAGAVAVVGTQGGLLSYGVAGHHGGLPNGGASADLGGSLAGRLSQAADGKLPDCSAWHEELEELEAIDPNEDVPICAKFAGCSREDALFASSFLARMLFSCLVDADFLCTERFMAGTSRAALPYDPIPVLLDRLEHTIAGFYPPQSPVNERRCQVLDDCARVARLDAGVFSLTVPTGGGKTLASLRFALQHAVAHGMRRVVYAVPYTSIIEQNAEVYRRVLGDANVLEHHGNYDFDDPGDLGSDLQNRLRLASENWDAPVIVTTNVQLFESLYASKTSRCRKLHNLAGSVIVLDEVQMVPIDRILPCIQALAELVKRYGCSVVLCTATQPSFNRFFEDQGLPVTEVVGDVDGLFAALRRTCYQQLGPLEDEELANRLATHDQVLCIVNNRSRARRLYDLLAEKPYEDGGPAERSTFYLTTLMHPAHRQRALAEINRRMREGSHCRVVATCLVEAGVDLDFPAVYRAMAGVDSIVQAAGRCNREGRRPIDESLVYVFEEVGSPQMPPEVKSRADVTRGVLQGGCDEFGNAYELGDLSTVNLFFSKLFYYRTDGGRAMGSLDKASVVEKLSKPVPVKGRWPILGFPFEEMGQKFRFIDNDTSTVIVPDPAIADDLAALRAGEISRGGMRRVRRYGVSVYDGDCTKLRDAGAIEALEGLERTYVLVDEGRYRDDVGLDLQVEEGKGIFW